MKFFKFETYPRNGQAIINKESTIEFSVLNCNDNLLLGIQLSFSESYQIKNKHFINVTFYGLEETDELKLNQDLYKNFSITTDLYKCTNSLHLDRGGHSYSSSLRVRLCFDLTTKCSDYQMKKIQGELVYLAFFLLELSLSNDNFSNNFIGYIRKFLNEKFLFSGGLGFYLCRKQYLSNIDMSINLTEEKLPFFHLNDGVLRTSIIKEQSENLLKFVNENYLEINSFSRVTEALRKISEYMEYNMCRLSFTFFPVEVFSDLAQKSYTLGVYPPTNTDENTILLSYENNNYLKKLYPEKSKYKDTLTFLCLSFSLGIFSKLMPREDFDFNFNFYCRVIWGFANALCGKKANIDSLPKFVTDKLKPNNIFEMLIGNKTPMNSYHKLRIYTSLAINSIKNEMSIRDLKDNVKPGRLYSYFKMPILQREYYDKEEASFQTREHANFNYFHNQSTSRPPLKMEDPYPFNMTSPNEPMEISKKKVNIRRNECEEHIQALFFSNKNNNNALCHERRRRHHNNNSGNYSNTNPFARSRPRSRPRQFPNNGLQNNNFGLSYIEQMKNDFTINSHRVIKRNHITPKQPYCSSNNTPRSSLVPRPPNF